MTGWQKKGRTERNTEVTSRRKRLHFCRSLGSHRCQWTSQAGRAKSWMFIPEMYINSCQRAKYSCAQLKVKLKVFSIKMLLPYHFDTTRKQETKSLKREEEDSTPRILFWNPPCFSGVKVDRYHLRRDNYLCNGLHFHQSIALLEQTCHQQSLRADYGYDLVLRALEMTLL